MTYSRRSSRSPRSRFTVVLLILTAVTILVLDLPGTGPLDPVRSGLSAVFRPIRAAGNAVFEPFANGWKGAFGYDDVKDENEQLRRELDERESQQATIDRLEAKVRELEKAQRIDTAGYKSQAGKVISGPISNFEQTVEIDVGAGDGIKRRMAVVTGGGVLGRVAEVRGATSMVQLITDPGFVLGVATKNGTTAIATGQGRGEPLRVEGFPPNTPLEEGDYIYTSGIDRSAYPADLNVGRISKVTRGEGVPTVVEIEPSADFDTRYVQVILKEAPR